VVAGVDPGDLADPALVLRAVEEAPFVVSLEIRESAVTDRADVVLPVVPAVEKAGSYLDWEGRSRAFDETLESEGGLTDGRVLQRLAAGLGVALGTEHPAAVQAEIARLGTWSGTRAAAPTRPAASAPQVAADRALLATWHYLLDEGRMQDAEPHLAGTRKDPVVRISAGRAAALGVSDGDPVTVSTDRGQVTLPAAITDMPDAAVWLPTCSPGSHVYATLGAEAGAQVTVSAGSGGRA
jgi:NADH-quinone oxidoreductase subunit G